MKILLLDLGKILRGGQRQVLYLARNLARTPGFAPLVVIPKHAPLRNQLELDDIPYVTLPSSSDLNPVNILKLIRIISKHKPDVVHTNDAKGASLAAMAKKLLKTFTLIHSRRVSYELKSGWSKNKYLAGDALVAVSEEIRNVLITCGIPPDKTSTIHSGIDTSLYNAPKEAHSTLTIGAVGALSSQKGFEVLIEALSHLAADASMPPWQCMIAGDGPLLKDLRTQTDKLGLTDSILFLGYRDSREVLPQIDILAVPSIDGEGSNAVIKEGWATRTPVITSDLPSNLELVTDGQNGLIFKNRDAKGLATAIVQLANDKKLADTLVTNGTQTVRAFTDEAMAAQYIKLYSELTS